jgi:diadenosine tetraphosphatase ApaH/serine/threonine PP2A family protein phosphatase
MALDQLSTIQNYHSFSHSQLVIPFALAVSVNPQVPSDLKADPRSAMTDLLPLTASELRDYLRTNQRIAESALLSLLASLRTILDREPNVLRLSLPINICGDIHGQMLDLFELFSTVGDDIGDATTYLFLGDYVDRGYSSVETFAYLAFLKCKHPNHFFLLRGNHESREINQQYGLFNDCVGLYGHAGVWDALNSVFDLLPIAAVVDSRIFCVHGGLSPAITYVEQISTITRKQEIDAPKPHGRDWTPIEAHAIIDLTWSDPSDTTTFKLNRRGKGYLFGTQQTRGFLRNNRLGGVGTDRSDPNHVFLARAHQMPEEGHQWLQEDNPVIVWSAPNYCYRMNNAAAVMRVRANEPVSFVRFEKNPESHVKPQDFEIAYFV